MVGLYINYLKKQVSIKQLFITGSMISTIPPDRNSIELICAALNITLTEFYSGIDEGNLDGEQMLLLELFAKVPQNKRKVVLDLLQNLSGED